MASFASDGDWLGRAVFDPGTPSDIVAGVGLWAAWLLDGLEGGCGLARVGLTEEHGFIWVRGLQQ